MANCLKKVIEKIVHPDQTCGILGRRIAGSLALVRDTIEYVKSRKVLMALVSLDQEKAFDCVSHEFMDRTLRALGLGNFFTDVVTANIETPLAQQLLAERIRQNRNQRSDSARKQREGQSKVLSLHGRRLSILRVRALHKRTGEDLYRGWEGVRIKDKQSQIRNPTAQPLDPHQRPISIPHQAGLPEDPWSLVRRRRRGGEIMGRKTGEDETEALTLEPLDADNRREVFGPVEREPTSAPVRCTSVVSAASNG
ncbi:hypothetical protein NDU88_005426 [Pleurodeles waltl]|uniref:Reverse transcriptase domain-containing protein n=1 Tax=Pleurodeles waltl TaxID=8319 RepID=A0AAV7X165_PLEWA|nr:hypothetical protein NDU88_005426 [Pleurodeles waltl]